MRQALRALALLLTFATTIVIAVGATTAAAHADPTPQQTVRAYIAAINAKDGPALCALLHPLEAKAIGAELAAAYSTDEHPIAPLPCPAVAGSIGSGGGGDNTPRWTRATIVRMYPVKALDRGMLSLDVELRDSWSGSPDDYTRGTRFYLARYHGRYVILRHSSTLDQAMWSKSLDAADAPPATREPRARDVRIPAAKAACATATWTKPDPLGDGRAAGVPALDLRSVSFTAGRTACVAMSFAAPLLPGTEIDVSIGESSATLYVLADGQVYDDLHGDKKAVPGKDFGLIGDRTLVMRFASGQSHAPPVRVIVDELALSEPLIHTQPKILGGDSFEGAQ